MFSSIANYITSRKHFFSTNPLSTWCHLPLCFKCNFWIFKKFIHNFHLNWAAYFFGGRMKVNPKYFGAHGIFLAPHGLQLNFSWNVDLEIYIVYNQASRGDASPHVQLLWSITKHNDGIYHTWMDDIENGTNVFVASALQDYFSTMTTSWKVKNECWIVLHIMLTLQLQMLFSKHDNNHCAMLYKHWYICMVLVLRNKYLLRLSKLTKSWWWKYVLSFWKTPMARFWKLSNYLMICQKIKS